MVRSRLANKQTAVCLFPSFVCLYQTTNQSGGLEIGNQSIQKEAHLFGQIGSFVYIFNRVLEQREVIQQLRFRQLYNIYRHDIIYLIMEKSTPTTTTSSIINIPPLICPTISPKLTLLILQRKYPQLRLLRPLKSPTAILPKIA